MSSTPITILLVEDSPSDALLWRRALQNLIPDGQVEHAPTMAAAIDFLAREDINFDVVLLDLSLPDSDGLDTINAINAHAPATPVVVLTSDDSDETALRALNVGVQDYLVKGQIIPKLLERTIRYAIERSQFLNQLRASEEKFRGAFDQTFQSMFLLSPTGIIRAANQKALNFCCASLAAVLGLKLWDLRFWQDNRVYQDWLEDAVRSVAKGGFVRDEVQLLDGDGQQVWVDFSLKPLQDEQHRVQMLIAEARDISDRKQAEADIIRALQAEKELNQLKTGFISAVSHEFRTPLTTINLSAELLNGQRLLTDEKRGKYYQRIFASVSEMVNMLDDLLLLNKAEAKALHYQPKPLKLGDFCQELVDSFQMSLGDRNPIQLMGEFNNSIVEMDENLIRHILSNLISNAAKYSPKNHSVNLTLHCYEDKANFVVEDQGIGISEADLPRLFEAFYRSKNVGNIKGTGLGLAIVKKCVELHGGKIEVESEVGVGTKFSIVLPTQAIKSLSNPKTEPEYLL
ncbi:multi-sensor signal transduction histidine kinase [Thalassoporum mexicanum PCC 7367]|uniref:sensor histidine kinase n=1 Tax=Thalassoporum mexicanum TaxID=3457544 RepID=UPI00029FF482|nr:ATP-binding protein [Pseudanabaena sp. PCC 7367]AFY69950.1 multi-sensor signal transduction histidine kinase [Pseudanabaena sp. PCC 7367]